MVQFTAASKPAGSSARAVEHYEWSPVVHHPVYRRILTTEEDPGAQAAVASAQLLVPRPGNRARGHTGQTTVPLPASATYLSSGAKERPV